MTALIPTLTTERLVLRPFRDEDHAAIAAFYSDDAGSRWVGGPLSPEDAWRRLAAFVGHWHLRGFGPFAVEERATGAWLGWCALWRPPEFPETEIGWTVREAARGQGFATEAALRVRAYAFETLRWPTLVSYIMADNVPSQRVAERLGALREGTTEIRGTPVDVWRHPAPQRLP